MVGLDPVALTETAALDAAAENAVAKSGRFDQESLVDALDPRAAANRATLLAEGRAAAQAGRTSYDDLDTAKAAVSFTDAVKAFKQTDLSLHFGEFSSAWVMRTASLVANGETRAAQNEIEKLVSVDPHAELKPENFPPDSLKQVEEARKLAAAGKTQIQVSSTPPGAKVFVDGRFRGLSPVTVGGLPPADHFVTLKLAGYSLAQQPASAGPVEVRLGEAEGAVAYHSALDRMAKDPEGPLRDGAARELGHLAGVDQVLALLARKSPTGQRLDLTLLRLAASDGHNFAFQTVTVPMGPTLAGAVEQALAAVLTRDEPERHGPVTHFKVKEGPADKKVIAGYALLGAAVALVAGGLVFEGVAGGQAAEYRNTPQTNTKRTRELEASARGFALAGDLSVLAGLVAAAPGAYLTYTTRAHGTAQAGPPAAKPVPTPAPAPSPAPATKPATAAATKPVEAKHPEAHAKEEAAKPEPDKKKADEDAAKAEEDKRKLDEEKKRAEEHKKAEEKKRGEDEKKKPEKKKPEEEDLRNY